MNRLQCKSCTSHKMGAVVGLTLQTPADWHGSKRDGPERNNVRNESLYEYRMEMCVLGSDMF
jgi:hypothetical protein